jgi:hypothetical protein
MMFIHGRKEVERGEGFVADFCVICRRLSAFRLIRIGSATHVYGVALGAGDLVNYTKKCLRCAVESRTDREAYSAIAPSFNEAELASSIRIAQLLAQTQPKQGRAIAERQEIEDQVRRDPQALSPSVRRALIREPFLHLSYDVDRALARRPVDRPLMATIAAGVLVMLLVGMVLASFTDEARRAWTPLLFGGSLAAVAIAIAAQAALVKARHLTRRVYPLLNDVLKPLAPTPQELATVLNELRAAGWPLALRLRAERLIGRDASSARRPPVIS